MASRQRRRNCIAMYSVSRTSWSRRVMPCYWRRTSIGRPRARRRRSVYRCFCTALPTINRKPRPSPLPRRWRSMAMWSWFRTRAGAIIRRACSRNTMPTMPMMVTTPLSGRRSSHFATARSECMEPHMRRTRRQTPRSWHRRTCAHCCLTWAACPTPGITASATTERSKWGGN